MPPWCSIFDGEEMRSISIADINQVGPCAWEIPRRFRNDMRVSARLYASPPMLDHLLEERALEQLVNTATLPGVQEPALAMPDIHQGYGFPIGGVVAIRAEDGVISTGGVGYDINCGVRLLATNLIEKDIQSKIKDLVNELFRTIPSGLGSQGALKLTESNLDELLVEGVKWVIEHGYGWKQDAEACEEGGRMNGADPERVSDTARKRGSPQLGSLGSGNHFLEIQKVHRIFDDTAAKAMGITQEGQLTVLIHCGSRGLGHQICSDYLRISEIALRNRGLKLVDRELACVPNNSVEGEDYRKAMYCALNFAWSNRQLITHWTRKTFEKVFQMSEQQLDMNLVYDVAHNIAKVERHKVEGEGMRDLVIHRKGATRAFPAGMDELPNKYYSIGQPVIIPGSMGTASWILLGNKKSLDLSFGSTAHGAGRTMSRSAAKRSYTVENVRNRLESKNIYVKALTKDGMVEETPDAYKDVDEVADVSHSLGIATRVVRLIPVGVIKG